MRYDCTVWEMHLISTRGIKQLIKHSLCLLWDYRLEEMVNTMLFNKKEMIFKYNPLSLPASRMINGRHVLIAQHIAESHLSPHLSLGIQGSSSITPLTQMGR